jgi:hypothetical protein
MSSDTSTGSDDDVAAGSRPRRLSTETVAILAHFLHMDLRPTSGGERGWRKPAEFRMLELSSRLLANRLRQMSRDGLLERRSQHQGEVWCERSLWEYRITEAGLERLAYERSRP